MAEIKEKRHKGKSFKEELKFQLSFLSEQTKNTVIDSFGIGWLFEDGGLPSVLNNIWLFIVTLFLVFIRLWIILFLFVYICLLITWWLSPQHAGVTFWRYIQMVWFEWK